jgi:hypothetical protein
LLGPSTEEIAISIQTLHEISEDLLFFCFMASNNV